MKGYSNLELGIYINLFPVSIPEVTIKVLVTERDRYQDLRLLRNELKDKKVWVYADKDKIYGYGDNCNLLKDKNFNEIEINLYDVPHLTGRMILEGFLEEVRQNNFEATERKGRYKVFNWNEFNSTRDGNIKVFRGFDLRSIFLLDHNTNKLLFGLVIDIVYALKDKTGQHLNTHQIIERFGSKTLLEVRQIQGDLIPTGINTEVSRQRLLGHILPFVRQISQITLPCGLKGSLSSEPIRVILGGHRL